MHVRNGHVPSEDMTQFSLLSFYYYPHYLSPMPGYVFACGMARIGNRDARPLAVLGQSYSLAVDYSYADEAFVRNEFYVLLAGGAQSIAYTGLYVPPTPRIEAGRWIAKNVPDGARVAILADRETVPQPPAPVPADPWQFQLPPMDASRLRLVGIPLAPSVLAKVRPAYVVVGDYQLPPLANREPLSMDELDFMDALNDTTDYDKFPFRNRPTFLGMIFEPGFLLPPHDLRYADPGITVYRRRGRLGG